MNTQTADRTQTILDTMFDQLGGAGRLEAMINARNFLYNTLGDDVTLQFDFSGSRLANRICLTYIAALDLYRLQILKITNHGLAVKTQLDTDHIYADQLIPTIETHTRLYLRL